MAERLAAGNAAIALIGNTGATVAVLAVIIRLFAPVSGAHFNPAVTFIMAMRRSLTWPEAGLYAAVQIGGCCAGALLAHAMFELPLVQAGTQMRFGFAQWLAEAVATFGLILVISGRETEGIPRGWWLRGSEPPTGLRPRRPLQIPRSRSHAH